ncbi:MAG: glycosyltransferase [Desulfobacca sp.]|nr:glycosyltransferase [Desulfobacca sp.]
MRTATSTVSLPSLGQPRTDGHLAVELKKMQWVDLGLKILIPLLLFGLLVISLHYGSLASYFQLLDRHQYVSSLTVLGGGLTLSLILFQIIRTILWARYKPYPLATGPLPRISVIIPAYNEGAMVEQALNSVAASNYPADQLEIICIDDGSKDDTWFYINQARQRYPKLIKTIRFPKNRGKKEGLYAAFREATGEFFVTIDSDCVMDRDALRQIVAPMLADRKIGAVAGNGKVYNRHQSVFGKMLAVRFVLAFDFLRASQSRYGAVVCTPGALSAYRGSAIRPYLEAWRHQTFLGAPCHHTEDRALTNFILRAGHYTVYQRSAVVHTLVPESYCGLCKMYLRWERGNVRESFVQLGYILTRYRAQHRFLPVLDFFMTQLEFSLAFISLPLMVPVLLAAFILQPLIILKFFTVLGIISLIYMIYYIWLERDLEFVYGVVYGYFAFFLLQWIYPYAFLTVRDRRWLTR